MPSSPNLFPADVLGVHDGDTFTVRIHAWPDPDWDFTDKIRLCHADAPELHTPLGPAARDFLAGLLAQGKVLVTWPIHHEKFGRELVSVYVERADGTRLDVVAEMLAAHQAVCYEGGHKTLNQHTGEASP